MGLILDTSVLIAAEKKQFDLVRLFATHGEQSFFIAAITASELLHGVERAQTAAQKQNRSRFVEAVLARLEVIDFDLPVARRHAVLWAMLEQAGRVIGAHDMLIAATALEHDHTLATLNGAEFNRVPALRIIDPAPFRLG